MVGDGTGGRHPLLHASAAGKHAVLTPAEARRRGRSARSNLTASDRNRASIRLCARLAATPWFRNATCVAAYMATPTEVQLAPLMHAAHVLGKVVLLPVIAADGEMIFRRWLPDSLLRTNRHGIAEPQGFARRDRFATSRMRCVVCAPSTAFDARMQRVGMGGGYYDRWFARTLHRRDVCRIGVAFDCQRVAPVDAATWDVAMHGVVTESRVYRRAHITA